MNYENEVMKCLYERGSVRTFSDKEVTNDVLRSIVDAGCHAATGGNLQPYSIIEIRSEEKKDALMATGKMQSIVKKAPVNLLFCIDWNRSQQWANLHHAPFAALQSYRHFWIAFQDTIIAAQNVCTAADSVGLGSVYIGTVESCFEEVKEMFKLPKGVFPVVILSLGYPEREPVIAPKLLSDIIMHQEEYQVMNDDLLNKAMNEKYGNRKTPTSDKNLATLYEVSKNVHGVSFAERAVEYAKQNESIHPVQRYFGLHYVADQIRTGNGRFLASLRDSGFEWVDGKNYD